MIFCQTIFHPGSENFPTPGVGEKLIMTHATQELNFDHLPRFQERKFVPESIQLTHKEDVVNIYQKLLNREIRSKEELKAWLLDRSELETAMDQQGSVLYIRMTCQTDDPARAESYKNFIETIVPAVKSLDDQLNRKYTEVRRKFSPDAEEFAIYDKEIETDLALFRDENVPFQTQVALLAQEYQTVSGAMTVQFKGKEHTLPQMSKYLMEPDRRLREEAWRAAAQRRMQEKDKFESLFDKMLGLRDTVARNAGCKNFIEYQFRAYHRFDYAPADCEQYHSSVEKHMIPLWAKILKRRGEQMKLEKLRPWDTGVDPWGRKALKPFDDVKILIQGVESVFRKMDKDLGAQFSEMAKLGLLDLASRKGKAPGGYQSVLAETRKPFIFMNAVGVDDDVRTLLHEAGHAFHAVASGHHPLFAYRHAPMEFCEVASMSMELLGNDYLTVFYNNEDLTRSTTSHLEDIVCLLGWVAAIDAFQQWIYKNPKHSPQERTQKWGEIHNRFGAQFIDWSGLEEEQKFLWHRQLHIFEVPFYYIEYGIAQLGALQLWLRAKKDPIRALRDYRNALALGRSRPLPELFKTAGLRFDFSENTIAPLMEAVEKELMKG